MSHRGRKLVYHLTALENLDSIIVEGLLSRRRCREEDLGFEDVADEEILEGRADWGLDSYVPFHFITRNPFDYSVVRNQPGQKFVILAVNRKYAQTKGWSIIPRHPLAHGAAPEVLDWATGMDTIEWEQMDRSDRTYEDRECKLVCMAEALSPDDVPFSAVAFVFVPNDETEELVKAKGVDPSKITVNENMFPKGCI